MPNLNIELGKEDYNLLREWKDRHGMTWEGVLKYGVINMDTEELE